MATTIEKSIEKEEMNKVWVETRTDVETVDWYGNPIRLRNVPALVNTRTKQVRVFPSAVARAEIEEIAKNHGLEPRDVPLLLMIKAQPGPFLNKEEIQFRYHVNKELFYQWKEMEKQGLGETFPHDTFEKADRGPVPTNIKQDLDRLAKMGLISIEYRRWGKGPKDESIRISLTEKGSALAEQTWRLVPEPLREVTARVKAKIFPMSPDSVRAKVHRDYPEYRNVYVEVDRD